MNSPITQILAGILIFISLAKIISLWVNAKAWLGFVKGLTADTKVTSAIALAAAGLVLYLLLRSGLDIVQILAVTLFVSLLILIGATPYAPRLYEWMETQDMHRMFKQQGLYIAVWLALLLWGLGTLLFSS